ncbi:MAG: hypothetical protein ACK5QX_11515 [bacterium]
MEQVTDQHPPAERMADERPREGGLAAAVRDEATRHHLRIGPAPVDRVDHHHEWPVEELEPDGRVQGHAGARICATRSGAMRPSAA